VGFLVIYAVGPAALARFWCGRSNWVAPLSEGAAKKRIAKRSADRLGGWSGTRPPIPFGGSLRGQACHPELGRSLFDTLHFRYVFGVAALLADEGPGKIKTCPGLQDRHGRGALFGELAVGAKGGGQLSGRGTAVRLTA
jgi:hypothetical protein